ncbi:9254_t:CDS:2 [Racocetra persica]|uniref:9254_t:CDS:1 n=1 Tax=Racocetra persica TaxID=160502 RepID=A0ACA9L677_9GLOM|nr:9254_t:CDS:2 [Racocetra persica]
MSNFINDDQNNLQGFQELDNTKYNQDNQVLDNIHFSSIQDPNTQNIYNASQVQFFNNDFSNCYAQKLYNSLLDTLYIENNVKNVYNEVANLCKVSDEEFQNNVLNNEYLELEAGLSFSDWQSFKAWLDCFALQESFNYKIRTSKKDEKDGETIRRANYVCLKAGVYHSKVTADPTKRYNNVF